LSFGLVDAKHFGALGDERGDNRLLVGFSAVDAGWLHLPAGWRARPRAGRGVLRARRQSAGERRFAPRLVCPHRGHAWPGYATASDLSLTANTRQRLTVRRAHAYVSAVRQAAVVATGPNTLPAPTPMHAAPTPPRTPVRA